MMCDHTTGAEHALLYHFPIAGVHDRVDGVRWLCPLGGSALHTALRTDIVAAIKKMPLLIEPFLWCFNIIVISNRLDTEGQTC